MGLADGIAWEKEYGSGPPSNGSSVQNDLSIEQALMMSTKYYDAYKLGMISKNECDELVNKLREGVGLKKLSEPSESPLKDSGARMEFETGAVRDISEGKGRCDLLPLDVVSIALKDVLNGGAISSILIDISNFKVTKDVYHLKCVLWSFAELAYHGDIYEMFIDVSKHYEDGAKKYSENNWMKGLPLHSFINSGLRHFFKYLRGDTDEPHHRAFVWNILGAMWTIRNKPELDDIMKDISKEDET